MAQQRKHAPAQQSPGIQQQTVAQDTGVFDFTSDTAIEGQETAGNAAVASMLEGPNQEGDMGEEAADKAGKEFPAWAVGGMEGAAPDLQAAQGGEAQVHRFSEESEQGCAWKTHVVESGDTLGDIEEQHYGDVMAYWDIFEANDIVTDPDLIEVGWTQDLPAPSEITCSPDVGEESEERTMAFGEQGEVVTPEDGEEETAAPTSGLDGAKALAARAPAGDQEYAQWTLDAADQAFASFSSSGGAKRDLTAIAAGKDIVSKGPGDGDLDVEVLNEIHAIVEGAVSDWIAAEGKGEKRCIALGSFVTTNLGDKGPRSGRHGRGQALDINGIDFNSSAAVDDVIAILSDLPSGSYIIGLPSQGEFFDPKQDIGALQSAADTSDTSKETVVSGHKLHTSVIHESTYDDTTKEWSKPERTGKWARTLLKSDKLQKSLQSLGLPVIPDHNNHMHIQE